LKTGHCICDVNSPDGCGVYQGCSELLLNGIQNYIYTDQDMFVIQVCWCGWHRWTLFWLCIVKYQIYFFFSRLSNKYA